jgi:hypothetical protein
MPWKADDAEKHTKLADTDKKRELWAEVANGRRKACLKKGGDEKKCDASAIQQANAVLENAKEAGVDVLQIAQDLDDLKGELILAELDIEVVGEAEVSGKVFKTVDGEKFPASDFLVVEDTSEPSTWHLQVKRHGEVDRRLMGGAKAALTSPGGYRGNKYEGPKKAEAIRKLKALYKAEDLEWTKEAKAMGEYLGSDGGIVPVTIVDQPVLYGPTSFDDLDAEEDARKAAAEADKRTYQLHRLIDNVMRDADIDDKATALTALIGEFIERISTDVEQAAGEEGTQESLVEDFGGFDSVVTGAEADAIITALATEQIATLSEGLDADNPRRPVVVDLRIIKPGPGNTRSNHFYPAETLRRDAGVFKGADLFVTEHDGAQRGEPTKVGKITDIVRFEPSGAPIGRSVIYDPNLAEKTRNRAACGQLDTLHCSILGLGLVRPGKVDGKDYKIVTGLLEGPIVEFVSRAGAGGEAVALVENETGGQAMTEANKTTTQPTAGTPAPAPATPPAATATQAVDTATAENAAPTFLAEADVKAAVEATNLPKAFKSALSAAQYKDEPALDASIAEAVAEVKALTGSGQVFGQGGTSAPAAAPLSEADHIKAVDGIIKKYTGIEVAPQKTA